MDLIVEDGRVQGVLTFDIQNGITRFIQAKSVILATGGAVSIATTPTAASSPVTAWRWPTATACRCATWNSCSTTRPVCRVPAS